jgi:RNA polymerase sigma factor (sigma-70 family)
MSSASERFNSFSINANVQRGLGGASISSLSRRSLSAEKPQDLAGARHGNSLDPGRYSASATAVIPLDCSVNDKPRISRFQAVALPYLDDAYNLARWLTRDPQDAEDVVQEAYLRALRYFDNFKGENPRGWVLTIVRNTFYTWITANRSKDTRSLNESHRDSGEEDISELSDPDQDTPEAALVKKDDAALMRALIEQLPPHYREARVLREMNELSYQQISEVTATPIGTVMSQLSRARYLLRAAWKRHNGRERTT